MQGNLAAGTDSLYLAANDSFANQLYVEVCAASFYVVSPSSSSLLRLPPTMREKKLCRSGGGGFA